MKNLLIVVLFVLAVAGCGTSYLLLRMPRHSLTALITYWLAVSPEDARDGETEGKPAAAPRPEVAAPQPVAAEPAAKEADSAKKDPGKDWKGLLSDNWYAGRRLTESDFRGKVALVYVWDSKEKPSVEMLGRIEEIWSSFKSKPLVVVGSHRGGRNPKIPKACKQLRLTFPVYEGASFVREPSVTGFPYIYIVNHRGEVVYRGGSDRSATEALVEALTECQLKLKGRN